MQRLLIAFTLIAAAGAALPVEARQSRNQRESQTEEVTRTVNIGAEGEIDVSNISGDIEVSGGSGTNARIDYTKTARAATADDARTLLGLVKVDIVERPGRVEVRTTYPPQDELRRRGWRGINVSVDFKLTVPQNTRLTLKSISGDIQVSSVSGPLVLESVSGSVRIASAGRTVNAKSISGNVEAIDTKIDGALEAGTISGSVTIRRVGARSLQLSSISGGVEVAETTCARIEAGSISGRVRFVGDFQPNGRYAFKSHSGPVSIAVGGSTGFQLEATSFSGPISTQVPLTYQRQSRSSVRATMGDGSAIVELTSFSGPVTIEKR